MKSFKHQRTNFNSYETHKTNVWMNLTYLQRIYLHIIKVQRHKNSQRVSSPWWQNSAVLFHFKFPLSFVLPHSAEEIGTGYNLPFGLCCDNNFFHQSRHQRARAPPAPLNLSPQGHENCHGDHVTPSHCHILIFKYNCQDYSEEKRWTKYWLFNLVRQQATTAMISCQ